MPEKTSAPPRYMSTCMGRFAPTGTEALPTATPEALKVKARRSGVVRPEPLTNKTALSGVTGKAVLPPGKSTLKTIGDTTGTGVTGVGALTPAPTSKTDVPEKMRAPLLYMSSLRT